MRNTIYVVEFDGNKLLNGDFDFKEEALEWAEEHLTEKPIVKAIDLEIDEDGNSTVYDEEELFHYPVEEVVEDESDEEEYLAARLAELENEIDADPEGAALHRDFPQFESVEVKEDINSDIDQVAANWDEVHEELKEEAEPIEEDVILFDPFGCDFSECEPMEVCSDNHRADCCKDFNVRAVDFFKELAAELGLEDEVEISEKECADGSCEEKHEDEIPCETCKDEISEISDEVKVEEPVVVEDEVKVDVAPEAEVAAEEDIVPEEVKANEEPNVEVQVADEKPAEEISKCHVCPECGKEICECGNKELVEKNKVTYTTGDPAIGDAHFNGAFEGGEGCSENLEENKVLTDYVQGEMTKGKSAEEVAETDEFKDLVKTEAKDELDESEKLIDDTKGKDDLINALREDTHPEEAQPEVDHVKAFNAALEVAKKENKPVIYGYMGADHHGKNRYFEIEHIVCDDLNSCRQQVMNRYHPNGSVLVAYPDKEFVDESLTEAPAFINKLKEKHADKKDAKFKELVSKLGIDTTDPYIVVCSDLQGKEVDGTKKQFNRFAEAEDYARSWSKAHLGIAKVLFRDMSKVKSLVNLEYITKFTRGVDDYNNDANLEKLFKAVKWNDKTDQAAAKGQDFVDTAASADGAEDSAETSKKGSKGSIANSRNIKIKKSLAAAGIDVSGLDKEKINALRKELFGEALEEDEDTPNSELENKELFVEEAEEEMSDLEFAEAFKKGLEEKHNCK